MVEWLIYIIGPLTGVIVGSFLTLFIQKLNWKRQRGIKMAETLYGPLYKEMIKISESLRRFEKPKIERLDELTNDVLYNFADGQLVTKLDPFCSLQIRDYLDLYEAAEERAKIIPTEEAKKNLDANKIREPNRPDMDRFLIQYRLFIGDNVFKGIVKLHEALLKNEIPRALLLRKVPDGTPYKIDVSVGGYDYPDESAVDKVCEIALEKVKKDPIIQARNKTREALLTEATAIIETLTVLVYKSAY